MTNVEVVKQAYSDFAKGKVFKANAIHVWTVENGMMTRFFQAVDTGTIIS